MYQLKHGSITQSPASQQKPAGAGSVSPGQPLHDDVPFWRELLGTAELSELHRKARSAWDSNPSWRSESPREVIDRFIEAVPDKAVIHLKGSPRPAPDSSTPALELYFLGQLADLLGFIDTTPTGLFSVLHSACFLCDRIRTKKFLLGVQEAVKRLEAQKDDEISVCDAGCGAIPIYAIYAALRSEKARCTALELNPHSVEIARRIVGRLGLADRIQVIEADATRYNPEHGIDLLVSETMNSGLTSEPLVQIMSNLSRYVPASGIILPSKVSVMAALVRLPIQLGKYVMIHDDAHTYIEPDWKMAAEYVPGVRLDLIEVALTMRVSRPGDYTAFVISEVEIGAQKLGLYDSFITMPRFVVDADSARQVFYAEDVASALVRYAPGGRPYATAGDHL
jgi:hypothetical protein